MKLFFYKILPFYFIANLSITNLVFSQTTEVFSTPGTQTWVVPPCVTSITVEVWGGGGAGGSVWSRWQQNCTSSSCAGSEICQCGGGGGGGGYARRTYSVTPGQIYTIVVGAGGIASVNSSGDNRANPGGNGGNSTFSGPATAIPGTLTGFGGRGGGAANNIGNCLGNGCCCHNGVNGAGGAGGASAGTNGTVSFAGGAGATGRHSGSETDKSGGGGGGAGSSGSGTNGGVTAGGSGGSGGGGNGGNGIDQPYNSGYLGTNGNPGFVIGGGGGGASQHNRIGLNRGSATNHVSQRGGNGQRGEVRITYNSVSAGGVRNLPTGQQCSGTTLNFSSNPSPSGSYTFSWGADTNGDGIADITGSSNTFSFSAINNSTATIQNPVTLTVSSNGVTCAQQIFTPNINPIPTVNDPTDQILCLDEPSASVIFTNNGVSNTTFNWNNNNTSIGLSGSGTGNIASFTPLGTGLATVTVTPVSTNGTFPSCTGSPQTFTFDVQNCLLPVEWLYFKGSREGKYNQLSWATLSELNCSHYEILHSVNAIDFISVGTVASLSEAGNFTEELNYHFSHLTFNNSIDYYRLKQTDLNGNSSFSDIISIESKHENTDIILYPNPAEDILNISISAETLGRSFEIVNAMGQTVGKGNLDDTRMSFSTLDLTEGVYFILIDNRNICKTFTVK